jgi:hypothetical protein
MAIFVALMDDGSFDDTFFYAFVPFVVWVVVAPRSADGLNERQAPPSQIDRLFPRLLPDHFRR